MSSAAECPTPQTVAEAMDWRSVIAKRVETANTGVGHECLNLM
jgi:hypothetical protein